MKIEGLVAATFSPMNQDGSLNPSVVPGVVEHLIADGVAGLYVCGSTGEGPLMSSSERRQVAEAYISAVNGRIPVIVQIGHDSLTEAKELAQHAQSCGADAISAIAPRYFGGDTVDTLVDCLSEATQSVPDMPFFYYHIPGLSGVKYDMVEFLEKAPKKVPGFVGIKYSALTLFEFQECLDLAGDQYSILFGCDEMLLSALAVGAYGAVGSTFNFAAPLYNGIINAYHRSDLQEAQALQLRSVKMIHMLYDRYRGQPAFKAIMGLLGCNCGPNRLPLRTLSESETCQLRVDLEEIGFFSWGRGKLNA
ncbi:MAG: N-acetylneuraminate lyase [Planctomycetes bacterium]|nr:N-acetylneuraminate lyase [Planctomycetota bacterium]